MTPPRMSARIVGQFDRPMVNTKTTEADTVTNHSARLTEPMLMRGSWPPATSVDVDHRPPPAAADRVAEPARQAEDGHVADGPAARATPRTVFHRMSRPIASR